MWTAPLFVVGCILGNLAHARPAHRADGSDVTSVTSASLPDGTPWNAPGAVVIPAGDTVTIDLGEARSLVALAVQGDSDDEYVVEGKTGDAPFAPLWVAPGRPGGGLVTRRQRLDAPVVADTLRIIPRAGDAQYSLGAVEAYCDAPSDFRSDPAPSSLSRWWGALTNDSIVPVKGAIASLGAALLLLGALLTWRGKDRVLRRSRDALLALLGVVSFAAWFNFSRFHFDDFEHMWDIYHYYIGAKYAPELGYTRIYECTIVAESEVFDPASITGRTITDLVTNEPVPVAPLIAAPTRCTSHFTDARWRDFKEDIMFFRLRYSPQRWDEIVHDHGYNATPVWGLVGGLVARAGPATSENIRHLAFIDPILLVLMWALVTWAFGWRTACVGLLYWGLNYPARYYWNGGAFLRMDWLVFAVAGICLVKRGRPGLGGFALAYSTLLRVFPGFIFVGLFLQIGIDCVRARKLRVTREVARFAIGAAIATVVLVPLALLTTGDPAGTASAFVENSAKHLDTPFTNNMGVKTLVAYQSATRARAVVGTGSLNDPFGPWRTARKQTFTARRFLYLGALVAFLALLTWAVRAEEAWVALTLGVGLIPFAAELTCYYYSFLLIFALLWSRRPIIGAGLVAVAAASNFVPRLAMWDDARYFDISAQVVIFVVAATALVGLGRATYTKITAG